MTPPPAAPAPSPAQPMPRTPAPAASAPTASARSRPAPPDATPNPRDSLGTRNRALAAGICALILTVGLARFAYTPMLPLMRAEAGLSALAGGGLAAVNYAGYMSGALIAALVAELHTKFRLYRLGLIVGLLSTAAMGLTHNLLLWAVLRYLAGLSSTAGMLLASGLVLNWLMRHGHRPRLGLHFAGLGAGIVVSGLAAAAMAGHLAWNGQWLALGLLGLVFFVPAWAWMPAPGPAPAALHAAAAADPPRPRWKVLLTAAYFCGGFGYVVSATFIVAIVEKLPLLAGKGNWVWVIVGLGALPASFVWDRVAHFRGDLPALILAYLVQIVSILLPAVDEGAAANILAALLYGATFVGIVSLTLSLIGRRFPANPAKAMARLTLSYGLAQILAPALAGAMAAASGDYRHALFVAAGVMTIGTGLLVLVRREERRPRPPHTRGP